MREGLPPEAEEDAYWKAAEKALAQARNLRGSQRIEALRRAGQLRFDAHKRRQAKEAGLDFKGAIRKAIMEDVLGREP